MHITNISVESTAGNLSFKDFVGKNLVLLS